MHIGVRISKIFRLATDAITNATDRCTYTQVLDNEAAEMSRRFPAPCHLQFLKQMRSVKFFCLVCCTSFAFSLLWVQLATRQDQPVTETLIQEAIENVGRDFRYKDVYRKTTALPKDFKYILLWTSSDYSPFYFFGHGQRAFLDRKCSVIKCYVTTDRKFFGGDLTKFDVIAFNGRTMRLSDLPRSRSSNQRYMYVNLESADNFPVCQEQFDSFFNWTSTYRLDSDIPNPYLLIRDSKGKIVGPNRKVQWKKDMESVYDEYAGRIRNKTKAAAWFVSNCRARSGRRGYVKALASALKTYGLTVDVYGKCGTLNCPKKGPGNCKSLLKKDYFFYLSLENSFSEDYVTEKVLTAVENDVVPIVYGGADYSRFLPPGSYIDGRKQHVMELAATINRLMNSPKDYLEYFRWKPHYTYHESISNENVCSLCEALHDKKKLHNTSIYNEFRSWWHPNYKYRCSKSG